MLRRKTRKPDMTTEEKILHQREIEAALASWDGEVQKLPPGSVLAAFGKPSRRSTMLTGGPSPFNLIRRA